MVSQRSSLCRSDIREHRYEGDRKHLRGGDRKIDKKKRERRNRRKGREQAGVAQERKMNKGTEIGNNK